MGFFSDLKKAWEDADFTIQEGVLKKYIGVRKVLEIPTEVITIPKDIVTYKDNLIELKIPDSVETIEDGAFNNCPNLTTVEIDGSLVSIYDKVFAGCTSLTSVTIKCTPKYMGDDVFKDCTKLTQLNGQTYDNATILNSYRKLLSCEHTTHSYSTESGMVVTVTTPVETTTAQVSESKSDNTTPTVAETTTSTATNTTTPKEITPITGAKKLTFKNNPSALEFLFSRHDLLAENGRLTSYNGKESIVVLPDKITAIGDGFANKEFSVDDEFLLENHHITKAGYPFLKNNIIVEVLIPHSVEQINSSSFKGCKNLKKVIIEDGVYKMGVGCFSGCSKLNAIRWPKTLSKIPERTFESCRSLESIELPQSLTTICDEAFSSSALKTIDIPTSVTHIGKKAFYGTSLTTVNIPYDVKEIGEQVFAYSDLTDIIVDDSNVYYTSIDGVLFQRLPNGKLKLVAYPAGKPLEKYTIPDKVTEIENGAFTGCTHLKKVILPENVKDMGNYTFMYSHSLESITITSRAVISNLGEGVFDGCENLHTINGKYYKVDVSTNYKQILSMLT